MSSDPTQTTYHDLSSAYAFFNRELFSDRLPFCLITMQRKAKAYGYFAGTRFGSRSDASTTDEIALNPTHFKDCTPEETLSTLVHEMTHLEQHHFGKPSRGGYHNKQWARLMRRVGLIPSDTGQQGGKETGQRVSHYIEADGAFARACARLIAEQGAIVDYVELWSERDEEERKKKAASKTKYSCQSCGLNAWAKPGVRFICADCDEPMTAADEEEGEDL